MAPHITRRQLLGTLGTGTLVGTAGCLDTLGFETQSAWRDPPLVEDRPDAVYVPAITEGMKMYGKTTAGPYGVALTYSYPHRFWTLTNTEFSKTVVRADDSVHLMVTLWDAETGTVLPRDSGVTIEVTRNGSAVTEEIAYPMLSQKMGLHYGSNYKLDGEGEYEVHVRIGGVSLKRTGSFAGRFETAETATFPITFDTDELYDVSIQRPENPGEPGTIPPMEMSGVPVGRALAADSLQGRHLGKATSGDAVFHTFVIDSDDANSDRFGDGAYLYVSPRTPYNGIILPMMGLDATLSRGGETVSEMDLTQTLDPELGYHYGATVESVAPGDELRVSVATPPQIARHDGYETAFIDMDPVTFTVPE
ncbi:fe2+ transport protein [Halogeometricum borinquense DSM 11551]|uniref:Fe2+ transport protein n=2 Tax=Halogeometricum borinquense TaxID=60847 RepID=E4NQJ3_HALBP|nr:iron transporter [Halogeometricum borinquense]ADQ66681.1 Fe2+ transport protein [Halogeometricum borinquense DSM 11551]ELY30190.1 fe2+ transport protein [Halogeometricum borinquense DSM 11551]RYJ14527.1 iron transporter [Halogeometricum borinquense]